MFAFKNKCSVNVQFCALTVQYAIEKMLNKCFNFENLEISCFKLFYPL